MPPQRQDAQPEGRAGAGHRAAPGGSDLPAEPWLGPAAAVSPMHAIDGVPIKITAPDAPMLVEVWVDAWPGGLSHPSGWVSGVLSAWHYYPTYQWTGWVRFCLPDSLVERHHLTRWHLGRFLASRMRKAPDPFSYEDDDDF